MYLLDAVGRGMDNTAYGPAQETVVCSGMREELCGRNSVVECQLPKLDVGGSNPLARFTLSLPKDLNRNASR